MEEAVMPRILLAECKQEVSTFNPCRTQYEDFRIFRGEELLCRYAGTRAEMGGVLAVFAEHPEVTVVPAYGACFKVCGGALAAVAWQRIAAEFLAAVRAAPPVDAVYFCLHGAMASEDEFDPEGYLLAETRRILGDNVPLVVSMDLHGIPSERLFRACDAIVAYHTYPHVDFFETGQRAARLLLRIMGGGCRPVTAWVPIPALVRGDELITETGAIRRTIAVARDLEQAPGGLSAGIFIGNPFTDVPDLQSYAFAVTDDDPERAGRVALEMAGRFWLDHEAMQVPLVGLDEAVARLGEVRTGTVALVDAADATSSGASGDSNAILRRLHAAGYRGRTLAPLVDPPAVRAAFAAGVGGRLRVSLGGALDPARFEPWDTTVTVRHLSDGKFRSESFGDEWDSGPTAVLEAENFTIVATTRAVHLFDRSLFLAHGQDPRGFAAVIVKSPHCQHYMYAEWCASLIPVDAPGATSANLRSLGHVQCPRPIFPLDPEVPFRPAVHLSRRAHDKKRP